MLGRYILKDRKPVIEPSLSKWIAWIGSADRTVCETKVRDALVSTVFLGYDSSLFGRRALLFESMVFGGPLNLELERYQTWDEAERGHKAIVARVRKAKGH